MDPSDRNLPHQISSYIHCDECLEAIPDGYSPKDWQDVEVGFTESGAIQVWCKRHNMNVTLIELNEEA